MDAFMFFIGLVNGSVEFFGDVWDYGGKEFEKAQTNGVKGVVDTLDVVFFIDGGFDHFDVVVSEFMPEEVFGFFHGL